MKTKIFRIVFALPVFIGMIYSTLYAQEQANVWLLGGNSNINDTTRFIGTTNYRDFIFKTNGITRVVMSKDGIISFRSLAGSGDRMVFVNSDGEFREGPPVIFRTACAPAVMDGLINPSGTLLQMCPTYSALGLGVMPNPTTYEAPSRLKLDVKGDVRVYNDNENNYLRFAYNGANAIIDNFGQGNLLINIYSGKNVVIGPGKLTASGDFQSVKNIFLATSFPSVVTIGTDVVSTGSYEAPSRLKLDVKGDVRVYNDNENNYLRFAYNGANAIIDNFGVGSLLINNYSGKDVGINGNVSIGYGEVKTGTRNLTVCGFVKAKEVIVESGWCDFVFEDDYKQMTWEEKEKYYKEKKHLVGIASGQEIEENGLNIGETMKGMIQNIEENSLDIIELYKKIERFEQEKAQWEKEKEELIKRIEALENR